MIDVEKMARQLAAAAFNVFSKKGETMVFLLEKVYPRVSQPSADFCYKLVRDGGLTDILAVYHRIYRYAFIRSTSFFPLS